jgi:hypothetical protein
VVVHEAKPLQVRLVVGMFVGAVRLALEYEAEVVGGESGPVENCQDRAGDCTPGSIVGVVAAVAAAVGAYSAYLKGNPAATGRHSSWSGLNVQS